MRTHTRVGVLCLGMLGVAASARAQKIALSLDCTTASGDSVGMRLCTELRDDMARSPRYREVISSVKDFHWGLHVTTVAVDDTKQSSAQSVAITISSGEVEYFMGDYVMITGTERVKSQAETILAALDEAVDEAKKSASK
jgi:hypothetical protein